MKDQFVPYELAVKLKELGFDEECLGYYRSPTNRIIYGFELHNTPGHVLIVKAPLWQQAFDWFLKEYNLYGVIIPTITMHWTFKTMTVVEGVVEVPPYNHVDANDYSTIEEARLACLEKLIELCKKN